MMDMGILKWFENRKKMKQQVMDIKKVNNSTQQFNLTIEERLLEDKTRKQHNISINNYQAHVHNIFYTTIENGVICYHRKRGD